MSSSSRDVQLLLERAGALARQPAVQFSAHERFQRLLSHGLTALRAGSYGIAACYVVRGRGLEVGLFGHNTLAQGDPHGHAEMNAVRLAVDILRLPPDDTSDALGKLVSAGSAFVRAADGAADGTELFSTLEPCPMCTVNVINAGVNRVTFAHEDVLAGALARERLERLGPLWSQTAQAQGLRVYQCQSDQPEDGSTYVPRELLNALIELFEVSRDPLDKQLIDRGFFHPNQLLNSAPHALTLRSHAVS